MLLIMEKKLPTKISLLSKIMPHLYFMAKSQKILKLVILKSNNFS